MAKCLTLRTWAKLDDHEVNHYYHQMDTQNQGCRIILENREVN